MLLNYCRRLSILTLLVVPFLSQASISNSSEKSAKPPLTLEVKKTVTDSATFLQSQLNTHMQNSAQWLDQLLVSEGSEKTRATAKGYVSLGFAPRARDLSDFDNQFKVSLDLPNLENKLSVIIDNDEAEEDRLPFQSISGQDQDNHVNAALNWYMLQKQRLNIEHRIGVSRSNLYAQSRLKYQQNIEKWRFTVSPSIEYYIEDGWGGRVNTRLDRQIERDQTLNFAFNTRYVESEPTNRVSFGIFHSHTYNNDQAGVTGVWLKDSFSGERSYYASYRWRTRFFEHWLFFEAEPFVEFRERYDFDDEPGIALRLIAYYGV